MWLPIQFVFFSFNTTSNRGYRMLLFDWARFHIRRKNMPWQRRKKPKKTRKRYEQILFRFIRFCERRGVKRLEDLDQDIYA